MKSSFPQSLNCSDFKWVFCGPSVCVSLLFTLCLDPKLTSIMCFRGFLVTRLGCILQQIPGGGGWYVWEMNFSISHKMCLFLFTVFCLSGPIIELSELFFFPPNLKVLLQWFLSYCVAEEKNLMPAELLLLSWWFLFSLWNIFRSSIYCYCSDTSQTEGLSLLLSFILLRIQWSHSIREHNIFSSKISFVPLTLYKKK